MESPVNDVIARTRTKLGATTYEVFLRAFDLSPKKAMAAIELYEKDGYICDIAKEYCKWVLAQP